MIWSPAAKATLRDLWVAPGATIPQIVSALHREHDLVVSRCAVIGDARRAGLSHQGPPTVQARAAARYAADPDSSRERERARRRAVKATARAARPVKPAPTPTVVAPPRPALVGAPVPLGIRLVETSTDQCKFIADDLRGDGRARCCGHKTAPDSSWCAWHRRVCTVGSGRPASAWIPGLRRAA